MNAPWRSEVWRILALVAVSLAAGLAVDAPFLSASVALAAYLAWHLFQGYRIARWLRSDNPARSPPTETRGIWRQIQRLVESHIRALATRNAVLEDQMDRYRQVARALPDAAVMFDRFGALELINDAARRLLGLREPEDLGRPVRNLIRVPEFVAYLERQQFDAPLEITSPVDRGTTLSVTIVPYGELDKYLLLARDTSRLHRLERMRQDFIANVSHEMKSPLTVIKGYVENLVEEAAAAGGRDKALFQIDQQTDRMCSIVEDLLALSNLETGPAPDSRQPVDIPALIRSVASEARELGHGRHGIETDIDETLQMPGSFNELYSAFSNIVFNAVTYTGEGGVIAISWGLDSDGRPRFAVTDTGIGIAPEHIPRLTERFYRVDQARSRELGGTGLGLAIVKHVLMRHDGRLEVASEPGKGSTFACLFPPDRARRGTRAPAIKG